MSTPARREESQTERWARANANEVIALPEPGETFEFEDWEKPQTIRKLRQLGVIQRVEKGEYRVSRVAWDVANQVLEAAQTLPCGHSGFQNLGDGRYSCAFERCDSEFDRETVEEVFG